MFLFLKIWYDKFDKIWYIYIIISISSSVPVTPYQNHNLLLFNFNIRF